MVPSIVILMRMFIEGKDSTGNPGAGVYRGYTWLSQSVRMGATGKRTLSKKKVCLGILINQNGARRKEGRLSTEQMEKYNLQVK
jgi:hypothetical protein